MTYYYALWIPQTQKGIPVIIKNQLSKENFRDKSELPPFEIEGSIDSISYRIDLVCALEKAERISLVFECVQKSEEGFLVYKLDFDDEENTMMCNSLQRGMKKAIYHYVKGFFHEHQYHSPSDDSLLNAYCSTEEIDLLEPSHKFSVLSSYLNAYKLKYAGYVDEGEDTIRQVINQIEQRKRLSKNVKLLRASILNNMKILEGEARYCDFLLRSCSDVVPQEMYDNIMTLRGELKEINNRMVSIDNYLSSEVSTQKAETSIRWGMISVVLAVLFFGYQSYHDGSQEIKDEVKQLRKEQNKTDMQLKQQFKEVESRQDSLGMKIEKIDQKVDRMKKK